MLLAQFEEEVGGVYPNSRRNQVFVANELSLKAIETLDLVLEKGYSREHMISKCGDIINLTSALLYTHGATLSDALEDNINKLKDRG